jgi:hypothetical protein
MWSTLIVLSALAGVVCGWILPGRRTVAWGGAVPWLGVLAWLLYNEYFVPYPGGGASMWPIAGSVAAAVGMLAAAVARTARVKLQSLAGQ